MNKSSALPVILVVLAALNLAGIFAVYVKVDSLLGLPTHSVDDTVEQLPPSVDKAKIKTIYERFEVAYNSDSYDQFWNVFSEYARSRMNKNEMSNNYDQLRDYFGKIEKGTYSYYEYSGKQGNLKIFIFHFVLDLNEDSKFGSKGTLKLMVSFDGREAGIMTAFINATGAQ